MRRLDQNNPDELTRDTILAERLSTGCILCESFRTLHFHHVKPEDAKWSPRIYSKGPVTEKWLKEIDKCVVLCARCHQRVHGYDSPPKYVKNKKLFKVLQDKAKTEEDRYFEALAYRLSLKESRK